MMVGHDLRQSVVKSERNPQRWDSEELKGNVHYCPVCQTWYNQFYSHPKHTPRPLCPLRHRLIIRAALSDIED